MLSALTEHQTKSIQLRPASPTKVKLAGESLTDLPFRTTQPISCITPTIERPAALQILSLIPTLPTDWLHHTGQKFLDSPQCLNSPASPQCPNILASPQRLKIFWLHHNSHCVDAALHFQNKSID
ncbi:hypothetical protein M8J76_014577 [Diaphorina citri]|nr:hypothetical protein M8J76_014577 [Diaphorina citri]